MRVNKDEDFAYTGGENLEALKQAKKYNHYQKKFILSHIEKINKPKEKLVVLDFGAGIGTFAELLRDEGIEVECLEIDQEQADLLRGNGFTVYTDMSQIKKKYDLVYSLNVFEHIEDDESAIRQLKTVVASHGYILVYVPAFKLLFTKLDEVVGHFRRYRKHDARRLAEKAGLQLEQVTYREPIGFFSALAYRLAKGDGMLKLSSIKMYDSYIFPMSRTVEPLTKKFFGKNLLAVYRHQEPQD